MADFLGLRFIGLGARLQLSSSDAALALTTSYTIWSISVSYTHLDVYKRQDEGKVIYTTVQEGYKEGIKWLHKLVTENLIDPEAFTDISLCFLRIYMYIVDVFF